MVPPGEMGSCRGPLTWEADSAGHSLCLYHQMTSGKPPGPPDGLLRIWDAVVVLPGHRVPWPYYLVVGVGAILLSLPRGEERGTGLKPYGKDFFNGSCLQKAGDSKEEREFFSHLCPWRGQEGKAGGPGQGGSTLGLSMPTHTHAHLPP